MMQISPTMSVVLVASNHMSSIRRTLRHLRAQTIAASIELIVVAVTQESLQHGEPKAFEGFHSVKTVPLGEISNVDKAAGAGIAQATTPIVAVIEDHAYPVPEWAEAIASAHHAGWDVVGSVVLNANPSSALSWSNLLMSYGRWTEPVEGGEVSALPGHNISFRREILTPYMDNITERLGRDGDLLQTLRTQGYRFYLERRARLHHANPSRLDSTCELRFNVGRLYGAVRAEQWPLWRRLFYVGTGPLLPLVRFKSLYHDFFSNGRRADLKARIMPALFVSLTMDALGHMAGYILGKGPALDHLAAFEIDRLRHLTPSEQTDLAG
jgi:hypothetical protein